MKLSGSDVAVSAAVLLGAAGLLYLFAVDLNSSSLRLGEKSLGTVVFKKLTATRKAPSGLGWERMRNNSPVYNADTLRTAGFSEASVYFDDGTSLDMFENSMLKLDLGGKAKNLEFLEGEISLGAKGESTSYTISSAAGSIKVDKGSKASFSRQADTLSVEVSEGSASLVKPDGSTQAIAQNQEMRLDVKSGQAALVSRPIVPIAPERNGRLLSFSAEGATGAGPRKAAVDFAWRLEGDEAKAEGAWYQLEVSASKDFAKPELSTRVSGLQARAQLEPGTWYWRVRDDAGKASPERKFSLSLAEAPRPAFPPDAQAYSFRSVKPEIRFSWTAMDEASSYLFELGPDPSFAKPLVRSRTTTASLALDSLGEGTWYWRVSPVHAFTLVGEAPAAAARSVIIARRAAMAAPAPTTPVEGSLYQLQDLGGKGLAFSWMPEIEAVSYELVVSKTKDLSSPIASFASDKSYRSLSGAEAAPLKRAGAYYWGLRWFDKEGNASPLSAGRSLRGIDGSIAMRLSFPPEGYRIADSLVVDARFGWKSNVPSRTVFQLSRDPGFQDLAYEETMSADTLIGHQWKSGAYYWRLRSFNVDGSVFLETPGRSFEIVDPFPGPTLLKPASGSSFYLREHGSMNFSWTPIKHADYYKLILRSAEAAEDARPILERNFIEDASLDYQLGELPGGAYRLSVQAFASSGPGTTRVIGYIGENSFSYKPVSYIKLQGPADNEHIAGLDARYGKESFSYSLEDQPDEAQVIVSTDPAGARIAARSSGRSGSARVGRLNPGVYYWTVKGSLGGLDVSSKESVRFEVDPPPPPPAALLTAPCEAFLYRVQGVEDRGLAFSWVPEADAASYELLVSRSKDLSSPFIRTSSTLPYAKISGRDAEALKRAGSCYWGLRWTNKDGDLSLLSPSRSLMGIDATGAIGLSFPPEGYRIAQSRLGDTRFSWKSSLPARMVFQLARDPEFRDLARQEESGDGGIAGRGWESGSYYWRVRAYNADGSAFLDSEGRGVEIVPPLAAPVIAAPLPSSSICLREGDAAAFSWAPVEGAEYYGLALRSSADRYASIVLEKGRVEGSSLACSLGELPSGSYRISVRGIAAARDDRTELDGIPAEGDFKYRRLSYIKLGSPASGEKLPGLDARRKGTLFTYELQDPPDSAELIVSSDAEGKKIVARVADRSGRAKVSRLDPGSYYWTVSGRLEGLDISARERFRFEVAPPPPLPAPEILLPLPGASFGVAELREKRSILLSWKPVAGATHYRVAVYARGGKKPVIEQDRLAGESYAIADLSVLDRGDCAWSVEARAFDQAGELEQPGVEAKASFVIDIPASQKAKAKDGGKLYGK